MSILTNVLKSLIFFSQADCRNRLYSWPCESAGCFYLIPSDCFFLGHWVVGLHVCKDETPAEYARGPPPDHQHSLLVSLSLVWCSVCTLSLPGLPGLPGHSSASPHLGESTRLGLGPPFLFHSLETLSR